MGPAFRPSPSCALGNLSLCIATHFLNTDGKGTLHPDVYAYGRDKMFVFKRVSDEDPVEDHGWLNSFIHLKYPHIGEVMRSLMQPSEEMQRKIDDAWAKVSHCVCGFHIRRGTYAEDSARFAFNPTASDEAVDAMIKKALELDEPVFIMSDSITTKKYFLSKVPKAVGLDHDIGFTACEHSQNVEGLVDEKLESKMNSVLEWFTMSKMPQVYTTMGGVVGRNVPKGTKEGVSSTFGYSAAMYGGKIPYYVFNDGYIFYPDGKEQSPRLAWSDTETFKYIFLQEPSKDAITHCRNHFGLWKVVVDQAACERAGILDWARTRMNVEFIDPSKPLRAMEVVEYKDLVANLK